MTSFKEYIDNIPNFPKEGIMYRDIQPLLKNQRVFKEAIKRMGSLVEVPDYWVAVESRGFLFASALSYKFGGGIKLIRKAGKLPNSHLVSVAYGLEYGKDILEISDDKEGGGKVVIVDDVFATGGTIDAAEKLCKLVGYEVIGKICLVDIGLTDRTDVKSLIYYEKD
jgi:adenine phosphoribosyltransferase